MTDYPRDNLIRMSGVVETSTTDDGRRTLTGVPIVFNEWTEISGWEGRFRERIAPGALNKTLAERADKVKVLYNHGYDPQIGEKPLGKPSVMEVREEGLYVEVPLSDTSYNKDVEALIDDGALDGMSFRFGVVMDEWENLDSRNDELPERTITELRLYELGPVTFPAYEATTLGVRSRTEYEDYRARRQFLDQQLPNIGNDTQDLKSDAAPDGTSADDTPNPVRVLSKEEIAAAKRRVIKTIKGLT